LILHISNVLTAELLRGMSYMNNNKGFNIIKVVLSLLYCIFYINPSYAYVVDIISQSGQNYIIRGHIDKSDLILENQMAWGGLLITYNDHAHKYKSDYWNQSVVCTKDRDEALQIINQSLAYAHLAASKWESNRDASLSVFISCSIDDYTSWKFYAYVGKPISPEAGSCKITAPLEVNFGIVTVGDNTKIIEKQVSIKCDKATSMKLSLQGDGDTNVLVISGTTIKLGVGGDTQSKVYNMRANEITTANLNFTMSDTGSIPGAKKGYVLLISEVP